MIHPLTRKLRIRDDGTGKGREMDGTFSEFEKEDAIILLGDPGIGKTTLFRAAAGANYTTVREFLVDPLAATGEEVFLDALDEHRTITGGQDASSEVARALCKLKKPRFRLSCRAADWFGAIDQEVLRVASASGRLVVLELRSLSRDEILNAVDGIVPDPILFLDEAESAGLGNLLGNPQTLELLARAWTSGKRPRNKIEAYETGVSELLKEVNPKHAPRGMPSLDLRDLRKAACAASSTLLLSNSVGISRADPTDGSGYISLSVVPYPNGMELDAALKRRLFISPEVDRFEPVHRTVAEFLAAEDLSGRIASGLPIDRVMALMCGVDGKPVSSLRGLFAWLMCRIGDRAADYVERDPYGVATYGDAGALPPMAQCAIWAGLRQLHDPWFLSNRDDSGSFRDLANRNTAKIIHELLADPATGVHLKIAVLEAIANSTENIGLNGILRNMVLEKHVNTWFRTTALRAFAKSIQNDWMQMEALDNELARATDDFAAPEVRMELLRLTRTGGKLPVRLRSIMEQVASSKKERNTFGRLYPLIALPSDSDLDEILDNTSQVLIPWNEARFDLQLLLDGWLKRRLENTLPIKPVQLSNWLRNMWVGRNRFSDYAIASLKERFELEPLLFEDVFKLLAHAWPCEEGAFLNFLDHDLWHILPLTVWPISPCEFFLSNAEKESDPERAAALFRTYLSKFPKEGATVAIAQAGFDLVDRRQDVAQALGNWRICEIDKWREDEWKRLEEESSKNSMDRAQNVSYLTSRLEAIREGCEESALAWAAVRYLGWFYYSMGEVSNARERLVNLANDEIADAFLEGFIRYAENPNIPKKEAVIERWRSNRTPYTHILLSLSVYLRLDAGLTVPIEALPHCIAAVVTTFNAADRLPGYDETLSEWILHQARENPAVVRSVLFDIWISSSKAKVESLPGFYELSKDPGSQQFLASLAADVLRTGIGEDKVAVHKLVSVLLLHDQRAALAIGRSELARTGLSAEVRAIWISALFVIDPNAYSESWKTLMLEPDAILWEAIEVIEGGEYIKRGAINLTSAQRMEIISSVGKRFVNVKHAPNISHGTQNPWNASEFIVNQIKLLAADGSMQSGTLLERLENDDALESYRNLIRHYKAQHEKQQRDSSFTFATPEQVSDAIRNRAPATPTDLLAFVVDHLHVMAREIGRTQRERHRAYWNESERKLVKPKREEVCSGLLAEDLQNRVQAQNLIVTVEHHMIADKECDLVVLQGTERLLPIEVKHHYHSELWTAWRTQLDRLYTRDAKAGGLGIYLVLWSGEDKGRMMPKLPDGLRRPQSAVELRSGLESLIPAVDRHRICVVVFDISEP